MRCKKNIKARKNEKARLKQINALNKFKASIFIDLLTLIIDLERIWKEINEMWLIEQAKKLVKKRPRSKLHAIDEENDEDHEMIVNKSWLQRDFVAFESLNDDENDEMLNTKNNAKHARYAKRTSKHAKHEIVDEFLSKNFFNDWINDEWIFSTMCNQFYDLMMMRKNYEKNDFFLYRYEKYLQKQLWKHFEHYLINVTHTRMHEILSTIDWMI
jgi:hypothetical protein